jgi:hypothetical protein
MKRRFRGVVWINFNRQQITLRDIERVKRLKDNVDEVTYFQLVYDEAKFLDKDMIVTILGTLATT